MLQYVGLVCVCVFVNLHSTISVTNIRDTEEFVLIAMKISICYLIISNHVLYKALRDREAFKWVVTNE